MSISDAKQIPQKIDVMLVNICKKYERAILPYNSLTMEDLQQEARLTYLLVIDKFDISRGDLEGYIWVQVNGRLKDYISSQWPAYMPCRNKRLDIINRKDWDAVPKPAGGIAYDLLI